MLTLVTAGNYVQLFIGWEGVGLASYLLISFWDSRNDANQGGLKAVIVNRIGDVFFLFALAIIWTYYRSFEITTVSTEYIKTIAEINMNTMFFELNTLLVTFLPVCLFIAACAKSAQIFFHTWLADAMEGPTPVSSLLHSATMVTAGVFLIIRSSHIFMITSNLNAIMTFVGLLTAIIPGLLGFVQSDIKKVIAYSTCSQLGYLVYACSLGYYSFVLFHLVTHAFFKCLLFLCSGSVIHAVGDNQDVRKFSHLFNKLPLTYIISVIGSLALGGIPALAGYYSKDLLLETSYSTLQSGAVIYIIGCGAAFFTICYSIKLLYLGFFSDEYQGSAYQSKHIHEAPEMMLFSMMILAVLSIVSGYLLRDVFTGPFSMQFWNNTLAYPASSALTEFEYVPSILKHMPTLVVSFGIIAALFLFMVYSYHRLFLACLDFWNAAKQRFYFDTIQNFIFSTSAVTFGYLQYKVIDRGLLEKLGGASGSFQFIRHINNLLVYFLEKILMALLVIISMIVLYIYLTIDFDSNIFG